MAATSQIVEETAVEFSCRVPDGQAVSVAGTFNNWDPWATPMTKGANGDWTVNVELPPGRHEYKYVIDGQWCCDPACDHAYRQTPNCVRNAYGTLNHAIEVS